MNENDFVLMAIALKFILSSMTNQIWLLTCIAFLWVIFYYDVRDTQCWMAKEIYYQYILSTIRLETKTMLFIFSLGYKCLLLLSLYYANHTLLLMYWHYVIYAWHRFFNMVTHHIKKLNQSFVGIPWSEIKLNKFLIQRLFIYSFSIWSSHMYLVESFLNK